MAGGKDADITYDEMHKAATKLTDAKDKIDEKLDSLERYIQGLVKDGYTTRKGSQAFEDSFTEFKKGAKIEIIKPDQLEKEKLKEKK